MLVLLAPLTAVANNSNPNFIGGPGHPLPVRSPGAGLTAESSVGIRLRYYGGRVVSNLEVVQVLYGSGSYLANVSSVSSPSMATFYQGVLNSPYIDWLSDYNTNITAVGGMAGTNQSIGRGSFAGQYSITPSPANNGSTISDTQIKNELAAQILAGHLPAPTADAAGNNNTYYAIFFPHGKTLTQGGTSSCVSGGFCAYHGTIANVGGHEVYYGVHADMQPGSACNTGCGSNPTIFNNQTSVAAHEMVETITDCEIGIASTYAPPLAWYDSANGENGDICNAQQGTMDGADGVTYVVQAIWSNAAHACIVSTASTPTPTMTRTPTSTPATPPTRTATATLPAPTATPTSTQTPGGLTPPPGCGNGIIESGEQCDDGNTLNGDCCSEMCQYETTGGPCNDGNACTWTDLCSGTGTCVGFNPIVCAPLDQCHDAGTCEPNTGLCSSPNKPDGAACNDGDGCPADTCQSGVCQPAPCPLHDAVVLPVKPVSMTIPAGKLSATKTLRVRVRNADTTQTAGYTIQLDADDSRCGGGVAAMPYFQSGTPGALNRVTIADGKTATATVRLTANAAAFTSFNRTTPHRCTLLLTASAVVPGGSNDPMSSNNTLPVEVNIIDNNDPSQTAVHETIVDSLRPVTVTIAAGQTSKSKTVKPRVRNADAGEMPGDLIGTVAADGTCPPGTAGAATFLGGVLQVTVPGGASKAGTLPLTLASPQMQAPNKLSPQRCIVTVTATGPGGDTDGSNNTTQLIIDVLDRNDY